MIDRAAAGPRITYDPEADAMGVDLIPEATAWRAVKVAPGVRLDLDREGRPVFLEILGARALFPAAVLGSLETPEEWLTLKEAAAESGLAAATLKVQIHAGRLPAVKHGRDWFVTGRDLLNYLESRLPQGRPARNARARRKKALPRKRVAARA